MRSITACSLLSLSSSWAESALEDFTRASKTKKVKTDFIDMFLPLLCLISAQCGSNSCCSAHSLWASLITKRAHQSQSVCFSVLIQGEMQLMCLFVLRSDGHTSPVTSGVEIKHPNILYARAENHHEQQLLLFGLRDKFLEYLPDPVEDVRLFSCWLHQRVS